MAAGLRLLAACGPVRARLGAASTAPWARMCASHSGAKTAGEVRTRYAPSPTGFLHLGGLRTALFSFLLARKHGGSFLLRIEDTDSSRRVEGAVEDLVDMLRWAGLTYDEGPYIQSQRLPLYREHAEILLERGAVYRCFCTAERLEELRQAQLQRGLTSIYDRACVHLSRDDVRARLADGRPSVVRLKIPHEELQTVVHDGVHGSVSFPNRQLDDHILLKSNGFPTYHLASVIDDHVMRISHVIRGDEWLASTPKHLHLYRALDWTPPSFYHLPLLMDAESRSKLSKRHGHASVRSYRDQGFIPSAVLNFVALLGWSPGPMTAEGAPEELFFDLHDLANAFTLERLQHGSAVVDVKKLHWINAQHLRHAIAVRSPGLLSAIRREIQARIDSWGDISQPPSLLIRLLRDDSLLLQAVLALQDRIARLGDVVRELGSLARAPDLASSAVREVAARVWNTDQSPAVVMRVRQVLGQLDPTGPEWNDPKSMSACLRRVAKEAQVPVKDIYFALRLLLSGRSEGIGIAEMVVLLGRETCLQRLDEAVPASNTNAKLFG